MRVLQIGKFFPPSIGGMESFLFDLAGELSKKISCDVLCSNSIYKREVQLNGRYNVIRLPLLFKLFSTPIVPEMISWLFKRRTSYDIIHVHLPNPMANIALFLTRPKSKLILHWHSDIAKQRYIFLLYKPLQTWFLRRADAIIATSNQYCKNSPYLKPFLRKCHIIPLGINPTKLTIDHNIVQNIIKNSLGKVLIFTLGRIIYYKGFEFLIQAMKNINAQLIIGGGGPLKNYLEKTSKIHNVEKKIVFAGEIPPEKLGSYYSACDIFCLPSIYKTEAFGIVQLEAMFFSKPIVSTKIHGSGISFVNLDSHTGFIVPAMSVNSLAAAINKLIDSKSLRDVFGKNAKQRFERYFTINTVSQQIIKIYHSVLHLHV